MERRHTRQDAIAWADDDMPSSDDLLKSARKCGYDCAYFGAGFTQDDVLLDVIDDDLRALVTDAYVTGFNEGLADGEADSPCDLEAVLQ